MNSHLNRIIVDPEIMTGKPVIKGTRITVKSVLKLMTQRKSIPEIVGMYPHLKIEDIYSVLEYAEKIIEENTDHFLAMQNLKEGEMKTFKSAKKFLDELDN